MSNVKRSDSRVLVEYARFFGPTSYGALGIMAPVSETVDDDGVKRTDQVFWKTWQVADMPAAIAGEVRTLGNIAAEVNQAATQLAVILEDRDRKKSRSRNKP